MLPQPLKCPPRPPRDLGGSGSSADLYAQICTAAREELNNARKTPQSLPASTNIRYLYDAGLLEQVFTEEDDQVVLTNGFGDKDWRRGVYQNIEAVQAEVFDNIKDNLRRVKSDWKPNLPADAPPDIEQTLEDLEARLKRDFGTRVTSFQKEAEGAVAGDLAKKLMRN